MIPCPCGLQKKREGGDSKMIPSRTARVNAARLIQALAHVMSGPNLLSRKAPHATARGPRELKCANPVCGCVCGCLRATPAGGGTARSPQSIERCVTTCPKHGFTLINQSCFIANVLHVWAISWGVCNCHAPREERTARVVMCAGSIHKILQLYTPHERLLRMIEKKGI